MPVLAVSEPQQQASFCQGVANPGLGSNEADSSQAVQMYQLNLDQIWWTG